MATIDATRDDGTEGLRFWEENREALIKKYPGKWLLLEGSAVIGVFNDRDEVSSAYQEAAGVPLIARATEEQQPVALPSVFSGV